MAILLCRETWEWATLCDCLIAIAAACKAQPHYICFAGPIADDYLGDLDILIRGLGLEDHFERITDCEDRPDSFDVEMRASGMHTDWISQLPTAAMKGRA